MKEYSTSWKSSKKPGKQRKYRYNAPIHTKRKMISSHFSKELIKKYGKRNTTVIKGDKVKVVRGQFKGHAGKVEKVDTRIMKIIISGIEITKKDGNKTTYPIEPSNVIITELNLSDKKRNEKLENKKK